MAIAFCLGNLPEGRMFAISFGLLNMHTRRRRGAATRQSAEFVSTEYLKACASQACMPH